MSFFIVHDNKFFLFLLIMFLVQASVDTKDSPGESLHKGARSEGYRIFFVTIGIKTNLNRRQSSGDA